MPDGHGKGRSSKMSWQVRRRVKRILCRKELQENHAFIARFYLPNFSFLSWKRTTSENIYSFIDHRVILWLLPLVLHNLYRSRVEAINSRGLKYSRTWWERLFAVGIEGLEKSGHTCSWGKKERIWRIWQEDGNSNMPKLPCCCCLRHGSCY